jgi:vacuolar-type H+-ATPase subunit I/STV1
LMALLQSTFERREILWVVWGSLALGMFLWTVGEAITAYYELLKDEAPYPSTADVAWVVGYIPLFVGFFLRFRSLRTMPTLREFLIGAIIFALLLVLGVVFVIGPIVTATDYSSRTEQFLDVLYPVGDLALAFAALLSVIVLAGGTLSYPWITLAAGFLITSVADLIYSYATWNDLYVSGNSGTNPATFLVDVPYFAAYVVIAFAMLMQARLREVI